MLPPVERPLPGEWDLEAWYERYLADQPDVPEVIPEELWDFAVWQQRAETLLAACRALAPDAAIEKEQLGEWYLLARARNTFGFWERLRTRRLVKALRQEVAVHRPYNPIYDLDLYMKEWRRLSPEDRIANYFLVRRLNARRKALQAAQVAADRQTRSAHQQIVAGETSALLDQWRRLRYEDRLESYHHLRDLNDAYEAAAKESKRNHRS
jgi:hypothetical protein